MRQCDQCGNRFEVKRRWEKFFGLGTPEFCSVDCLLKFVRAVQPLGASACIWREVKEISGSEMVCEMGEGMCYSPLLGMSFRSGYECLVAERLVLTQQLQVKYERYRFEWAAGNKVKQYHPDFFLNEFDVWLEVKGKWHSGDKAKFLKGAAIVGWPRMILVGPQYFDGFRQMEEGFQYVA